MSKRHRPAVADLYQADLERHLFAPPRRRTARRAPRLRQRLISLMIRALRSSFQPAASLGSS